MLGHTMWWLQPGIFTGACMGGHSPTQGHAHISATLRRSARAPVLRRSSSPLATGTKHMPAWFCPCRRCWRSCHLAWTQTAWWPRPRSSLMTWRSSRSSQTGAAGNGPGKWVVFVACKGAKQARSGAREEQQAKQAWGLAGLMCY